MGGGLGPVYPAVWRPQDNRNYLLVGYNTVQITQHDVIEVSEVIHCHLVAGTFVETHSLGRYSD